jgi:hypothetical protein
MLAAPRGMTFNAFNLWPIYILKRDVLETRHRLPAVTFLRTSSNTTENYTLE